MFEQIFTISRNTFLESIRQPIYVVLLLATGLILCFGVSFAANTMDDDNKMLIDMGLGTLLFFGYLLTAFTATGVVWAEVENRTALTVMSKPVPRPVFILGKYFGVAGAMLIAMLIWSTLFLLTVRHKVLQTAADNYDLPVILFGSLAWFGALATAAFANYYYRRVFASTFVIVLALLSIPMFLLVLVINPHWEFQSITYEFYEAAIRFSYSPTEDQGSYPGGRIVLAMIPLYQAVLVFVAIAIAVSTRVGQLMTLLICLGIYVLGVVMETLIHPLALQYSWSEVAGVGSFFIWILVHILDFSIASLQVFWLTPTINQTITVSYSHLGLLSGYCALLIAAYLSLAVALFQTREVG